MPYRHTDPCFFRRRRRCSDYLGGLLLLAIYLGLAPLARAGGAGAYTAQAQAAGPLSIKIYDDRMTLTVAKAPQVYIYGYIDASAPQRFEALMRSWKVPTGSDVYLNASGGDLDAGLALGRLFRKGAMVTHLGVPTRGPRKGLAAKTAVCMDACTYAYLGGLYRWAPTGSDRIGFSDHAVGPMSGEAAPQAGQAPGKVVSYLKDMGIDPGALAQAPSPARDGRAWLDADRMLSVGLSNNGRLPLTASAQLSADGPYLVLNQLRRNGGYRITLQCKRDGITMTSYDMEGTKHARQIAVRAGRSYFELDGQETYPQQDGAASVAGESVMLSRRFPATQLGRLLFAHALGAWVTERGSALRYGFAFQLAPVRGTLKQYYESCWEYAPWQVPRHS